MTSSGRGRGATNAESTKLQIIRAVLRQPGRNGKQIADSLGLDRSRVNSFLYGEGKRRFGLMDTNWRWYPERASEIRVPSNRASEPVERDDRAIEQTDIQRMRNSVENERYKCDPEDSHAFTDTC